MSSPHRVSRKIAMKKHVFVEQSLLHQELSISSNFWNSRGPRLAHDSNFPAKTASNHMHAFLPRGPHSVRCIVHKSFRI